MPTKAPLYGPPKTERPSAAKRGYGHRWRIYRRWFLSQPENALCRQCKAEGKIVNAIDVDHIKPVRGADDPLFWEPSNHQGLCLPHHRSKTRIESMT
jgi:5-methylcytosine-specific restriction protein A